MATSVGKIGPRKKPTANSPQAAPLLLGVPARSPSETAVINPRITISHGSNRTAQVSRSLYSSQTVSTREARKPNQNPDRTHAAFRSLYPWLVSKVVAQVLTAASTGL